MTTQIFVVRQKSTGLFSSGSIPAFWGGIRQAMLFMSRPKAEQHVNNPQCRGTYQAGDYEIVAYTLVELKEAAITPTAVAL